MQSVIDDLLVVLLYKSIYSGEVKVLLLGGEARSSQRHAVAPLPALLALPISDAVLLVHHLLQQRLVVGIQRSH